MHATARTAERTDSTHANAPRTATLTVSGAVVLGMATWFSTAPVLDDFAMAVGVGPAGERLLTVAVPVGFVIGALLSALASLADRHPPHRLLAAGAGTAAAANLLPALAPDVVLTFGSRLLVGVGLALVLPVALKVTASWHRSGRGEAIGTVLAGLCLATAAPHVLRIADPSWRTVLVTTSLLGTAGAVISWHRVVVGPYRFETPTFDPRHVLRPFRTPAVRRAYVGYFGHMWELYAAWAWTGALLAESFDPSPAALLTAAATGAGALGAIVGGRAGDRIGFARSARRSLLRSGSCAALLAFFHDGTPLLTVAIAIAWGYWVIADSALFTTLVTTNADRDIVGTAVTVQLAVGFSLTTATLWLVPALRDAAGWTWALLALVPGPLLGWAAMAPLERADDGMHS
jgi:predicted MFS family arabinose efflux permease